MDLEQKTNTEIEGRITHEVDPLLIEQFRPHLNRLPDGKYTFKEGKYLSEFDFKRNPGVENGSYAALLASGIMTAGVLGYFAAQKLSEHYEWIEYLRIPIN